MTKGERKGLIWGGIIFGIVLAVVLRFNLVPTEAIQSIITFFLVSITVIYAKRTSEIAKATKEQAEETKKQRYDAVRPVIDIVIIEKSIGPRELMKQGFDAKEGKLPKDLPCKLRNVGAGPAIEVYSFIEGTDGKPRRWYFGIIPVAVGRETEYTDEMRLLLEQMGNRGALVAHYRDLYDNRFESIRDVSVEKDKQAVNIGPVQVYRLPQREHTDDS